MSENLPAPRSEWVPEWIADLRSIPGAAAAIGRFVGGAGKAGAAWWDVVTAKAEQKSQAIRDQTGAHTALTKEAVKVAAAQLKKDPELAERAVDHVMAGMIQKQENREAIALKTIEHLRDEPSGHLSTEPPSEDWMNVFESYAEKASSETLREHWAQILAGEIRKPGSFSLLTLQVMSVLDTTLAQRIHALCPFVVRADWIVDTASFHGGQRFGTIMALEAVGLLRTGVKRAIKFDESGEEFLVYKDHVIVMSGIKGQQVYVDGIALTLPGQEIFSFIEHDDDLAYLKEARDALRKKPGLKTDLYRILRRFDDGIEYDDENPIQ